MATNPTPNVVDYTAFLFGVVGIPPSNLPPQFTGTCSFLGGQNTITVVQVLTGSLLPGNPIEDQNGLLLDGTTILFQNNGTPGGQGDYTISTIATADQATAAGLTSDNQTIPQTLGIAQEIVNTDIGIASGIMYTLAVYNLAADRLLNYAPDVQGQTYFQTLRCDLKLALPILGVVQSSGDQGTNTSVLNPEQMKLFTMQDLQTLKTPYGRTYMGIAQKFGLSLWGVS